MLAWLSKRAMVMALVLSGCAGGPPPTLGPSAPQSGGPNTPDPTVVATPAAVATPGNMTPTPALPTTAVPTPPPDPTERPVVPCMGEGTATTFEPDSIVCVVAGPLRLRSKPSTADDSLKFEPLLAVGERLFVMDGPTSGSGYAWYLVERTPGYAEDADGWVAAAAKDGTPWLASTSVPCPAQPSLQELGAMDPMQRLHCYHDREFTFTDTLVAGPMCGDGGLLNRPPWLRDCFSVFFWGGPSQAFLGVPPDLAPMLGDVEYDVPIRATVTAHMDDPVAATCGYEGFETTIDSLAAPGVVLQCRTFFIATAIELQS